MIEKIFIPTVNRVDNQITYNNLPLELRKKVTMVVQEWERNKYQYDCEYLVLPPEINLKDYYCLPKTRKLIYEAGKNIKYAVIDDDLIFKRRNSKYWCNTSNMEKSKKDCTEDDIIEMFELYDSWLDEDEVTVCGCSRNENPPRGIYYVNNSSLGGALWINGPDFKDILSSLDLTSIKVTEDAWFLLSLLTRGYGNRVSQEFMICNRSVNTKKLKSACWDEQTYENTLKDHEKLATMFPGIFEILYDKNGNRVKGGFRNYGKTKTYWSKAYNNSKTNSLGKFFT